MENSKAKDDEITFEDPITTKIKLSPNAKNVRMEPRTRTRSTKKAELERKNLELKEQEKQEQILKWSNFNDVDPETSKVNAQNFFMKCQETLPADEIQNLVQKILLHRSKVLTYSFKGQAKLQNRSFLLGCRSFFEKCKDLLHFTVCYTIFLFRQCVGAYGIPCKHAHRRFKHSTSKFHNP